MDPDYKPPYIIVDADYADLLEAKVQVKCEHGYVPVGGISIQQGILPKYFQAMALDSQQELRGGVARP